jgi:cytochrome b561
MIPDDKVRLEFNPVAKMLHWVMAALIFVQFILGGIIWESFSMFDGHTKSIALQGHKATGMVILALALVRLTWRFTSPLPSFPSDLPKWEKIVATSIELTIYGLFILLPIVGWMIISTFAHPSTFLGFFTIPNLPALPDLADKKGIRDILITTHGLLSVILLGLVMAHIGAALKHHFIDRDEILFRMTPHVLERALRFLRGGV